MALHDSGALGAERLLGEHVLVSRGDGRWVGQYEVNGKRKYVNGKTRAEVFKKLTKAIAERDAGLAFDAEGLTVGEYLTCWLNTLRGTVKENTWQGHEINVRVHLSSVGFYQARQAQPVSGPIVLPRQAR